MEILVSYLVVLLLVLTNCVMCIMDYNKRFYNKNASKIVFPEPVENEVKEIPLDLIRRLNELTTMEEFMKTMVDTESEPVRLSERIGLDDVERSALKPAKRAKCMPELTTVCLKPDNKTGVMYYPACTRVQRCGGCCLHDLLTCQPVETEILPMTIAVSEYRGGHQLHFKETKIVEVEQHTKCQCDCKIRPEDCSKHQRYSPDKCRCECTNTDKERKCYKEAPKKIWDASTCSCECREELECGSGFDFDPFNCSCVPARRKKPSFIYDIEK